MAQRFDIPLRHRVFTVVIADDGALELWLDGCLRKRRKAGGRQPLYVWTNVELDWEEHRYVEARYFTGPGRLEVTVNGAPILERRLTRPPRLPTAAPAVPADTARSGRQSP